MQQDAGALFIGLVQRKQATGLLGRFLPRLVVIDKNSIDFWKYPQDVEKSFDEIKEFIGGMKIAERSRALVSRNFVFRVSYFLNHHVNHLYRYISHLIYKIYGL
jgi:hypothetical protein